MEKDTLVSANLLIGSWYRGTLNRGGTTLKMSKVKIAKQEEHLNKGMGVHLV